MESPHVLGTTLWGLPRLEWRRLSGPRVSPVQGTRLRTHGSVVRAAIFLMIFGVLMNPSQALGGATLSRVAARPLGLPQVMTGNLQAVVDRLVQTAQEDTAAYDLPTREEALRLASAFRAVIAGDLGDAMAAAGPLGYEIVRFRDVVTGRRLIVLAERRYRDRSSHHGWGMYVYSPGGSTPLTIEVAHPTDDLYTGQLGVEMFRAADATSLFVAGAGRHSGADGSADVAHSADSVFEAIHRVALETGDSVIQPHGFDAGSHPDVYGDAVVSSGDSAGSRLVTRLAGVLRAEDLDVCLFDGYSCSQLGATTNVQGESARFAGVSFVHLELALPLREDPASRKMVAEAIAAL